MVFVPISLGLNDTINLDDADGFNWDIRRPGIIDDGETDAFDGGFVWTDFPSTSPNVVIAELGREVNTEALTLTGQTDLVGWRSVYVSETKGYARFLDTFTNLGATTTYTYTLQSNLGSDLNTNIVATGDGDTVFEASDRYLTTSDGAVGVDSLVTHVFADNTGTGPTSAQVVQDNVEVTYSFTLNQGDSISLLSFGFQSETAADAAEQVADFETNPYTYLEGLTLEERNSVANFDVDDTHVFAQEGNEINLLDGDGFLWDIDSWGGIADGGPNDAFDGGFAVEGTTAQTDATFDEDGREVNFGDFGPDVLGIEGTRSVYVDETLGFTRFLDTFTSTFNNTPIVFDYRLTSNLGSDGSTVVENTGAIDDTAAGDSNFTTADEFITTSDGTPYDPDPANGISNDPFVTHVFHDGTLAPNALIGSPASGNFGVEYSLTVQPGETVSILSYGFQNEDAAAANAQIDDFDAFTPEYLAGLSQDELNSVINFDVDTNVNYSSGDPYTLRDAEGFKWDFNNNDLAVVRGENAFNSAFEWSDPIGLGQIVSDESGRELNRAGVSSATPLVELDRSVYVSDESGFVRYLDSITNDNNFKISYTYTLDSELHFFVGNTNVIATGSGDTLVGVDDTYVTSEHASSPGGVGSMPLVTQVFNDGTGLLPDAFTQTDTGDTDEFSISYTFDLLPGQTVSLLSFGFQNASVEDAVNDVNSVTDPAQLKSAYLEGLTLEEAGRVQNFDLSMLVDVGGANVRIGTAGNDILPQEEGDSVFGGFGDDSVLSLPDNTFSATGFIDGGLGEDTLVVLNANPGVYLVDMAAGHLKINGVVRTNFVGIENVTTGIADVIGDDLDNIIIADGNNDRMFDGAGGNDTIKGFLGDDTLNGGTNGSAGDTVAYDDLGLSPFTTGVTVDLAIVGIAQDTVSAGMDTLSNFEHIVGSDGNDTLRGDGFNNTLNGGIGDDLLDGALGIDTADFSTSREKVIVRLDLPTQTAATVAFGKDTLISIENIIGSRYADTIYGSNVTTVVNEIRAGEGADRVYGGRGTDRIYGEGGADLLLGDGEADTIYGGEGNDRIYGKFSTDTLYGGEGNDLVVGDSSNDVLFGEAGNDRLLGGTGDDILDGGDGADLYDGSSGNDILKSSAGADRLNGRGDADTFEFEPGNDNDRIFLFEDDIDTIAISNDFGFASAADIINNHSRAIGNTLYIDLDPAGGDFIQVVNWLTNHTAQDLIDDISFFDPIM